jgi:hypothetical protein
VRSVDTVTVWIGLRPGRFLGELRDIHVAECRQNQRARDRRRGHHQHMRRNPLGRQPQALVHAETVLFVDDGQQKIVVDDGILEQRMRADDDLRFA